MNLNNILYNTVNMIDQIYTYFTIEIIFLWLNLGVLPFWLILVFFPRSQICRVFITSIFPFIILSFAYTYLTYVLFNEGYDFIRNFELYLGLDSISYLFKDKSFLILFGLIFYLLIYFVVDGLLKIHKNLVSIK